jgi:hypothetical protein
VPILGRSHRHGRLTAQKKRSNGAVSEKLLHN